MAKRKLNEIEKRISLKNLEILKADAQYIKEVSIPKTEFTIRTADVVIKKQLKDTHLEKQILQAKLDELNRSIDILEKQIHEGVVVGKNEKKN